MGGGHLGSFSGIVNRMHRHLCLTLWVVWVTIWTNGNPTLWAQSPNSQNPNPLEPLAFSATTITGENWMLKSAPPEQKRFTVVCFLGTECPMVRQYASRLQTMADQFANQNVEFVALFSNQQDSVEEIKKFVKEHGVRFTVIKDFDNRIADQFQAERTPEVYVLNQTLRTIYQGRIDDQFAPGVAREKPTQHDLKDVLVQTLEGKEAANVVTPATGCRIGRVRAKVADAKVTYCRDVVPVLQRNCIECHRAGEIGPFELTMYDEVIGWADTMVEVVQDGRMPPWHADPNHGSFANARRMSEEDKQVLRDWAAAGMPYGEEKDLPKESHMAELYDFKLVPDVTVKMAKSPYKVPAEGMVEYQYFVVDPGFTEDKWVAAANVTPGNRSVVHHAIVFVRPPDGSSFSGNGWLTAYVPGQKPMMPPEGHARRVPAGSKLVFQMHYTTNGVPQEDLSEVSLCFLPEEKVTHEVFTMAAINQDFEIPPGAAEHAVLADLRRKPEGGVLLAVSPHMHLRGKSFELLSVENHDTKAGQTLLNVPRYDFNWQHTYVFAEPQPLSKLNDICCRVTFDNSPANPFNPDPSQWVTWGDQTWEEMAVAFFEVAVPRFPGEASSEGATKREKSNPVEPVAQKELAKQRQTFVDEFFIKLDKNGNGTVELLETPLSLRRFGFQRFDRDRDNKITRSEVEQSAEEAIR